MPTNSFIHGSRRGVGRALRSDAVVSQILVVRPRAPLGRDPCDDLVGILDVASLAVHAVGGVDLEAQAVAAVRNHLVYTGRTEARARIPVLDSATRRTDRRVRYLQVHGLVLVVR